MKINLRGCRWERPVPPTTREKSVQFPVEKNITYIGFVMS